MLSYLALLAAPQHHFVEKSKIPNSAIDSGCARTIHTQRVWRHVPVCTTLQDPVAEAHKKEMEELRQVIYQIEMRVGIDGREDKVMEEYVRICRKV